MYTWRDYRDPRRLMRMSAESKQAKTWAAKLVSANVGFSYRKGESLLEPTTTGISEQ